MVEEALPNIALKCEQLLRLYNAREQVRVVVGEHILLVRFVGTLLGNVQSGQTKITYPAMTYALHLLGANALIPHEALMALSREMLPIETCIGCAHNHSSWVCDTASHYRVNLARIIPLWATVYLTHAASFRFSEEHMIELKQLTENRGPDTMSADDVTAQLERLRGIVPRAQAESLQKVDIVRRRPINKSLTLTEIPYLRLGQEKPTTIQSGVDAPVRIAQGQPPQPSPAEESQMNRDANYDVDPLLLDAQRRIVAWCAKYNGLSSSIVVRLKSPACSSPSLSAMGDDSEEASVVRLLKRKFSTESEESDPKNSRVVLSSDQAQKKAIERMQSAAKDLKRVDDRGVEGSKAQSKSPPVTVTVTPTPSGPRPTPVVVTSEKSLVPPPAVRVTPEPVALVPLSLLYELLRTSGKFPPSAHGLSVTPIYSMLRGNASSLPAARGDASSLLQTTAVVSPLPRPLSSPPSHCDSSNVHAQLPTRQRVPSPLSRVNQPHTTTSPTSEPRMMPDASSD
eukprot:m.21287 g.21287  ORF g.21287 m.21287 type:complete len:512 (-) comp8050_c0_seq1:23-1558(-)